MRIIIENQQNKLEINESIYDLIKKSVEVSLKLEEFDTLSEINILLVDNVRIRDINEEHRSVDKETDVLSFPMLDVVNGKVESNPWDYDLESNMLLLGDIVVSLEMVKKQSEQYGHSFERELAFLITHGVFHLLGYDHIDEEQESVMIGKQEEVLDMMGLKRS